MELQEIKHNLTETRGQLLEILAGLSEDQLNSRKIRTVGGSVRYVNIYLRQKNCMS